MIIKYQPKNKVKFLSAKFKNLDIKKLEKMNLHSPLISEKSAKIAKINSIRNILKKFQINFAKKIKIVVLRKGYIYKDFTKI